MSIVLAYSVNTSADAAFAYALEEAQLRSCPLIVVNSARGGVQGDPHFASEEHLSELRERAAQAGVPIVIEQPVRGKDADEEVLEAAERHGAQAIVIGTRRRSAMGKFILGSTAQRILMEAGIPVTAVKPPTSQA